MAVELRNIVQRRQGFLFLPLVYRLAARLEQMSWEELADDPSSAAYALRSVQRLFRLRAVATHFRLGAEAEACGADLARDEDGSPIGQPTSLADAAGLDAGALQRAPLAQLLDVTGRLSEELRGQAATVGVLTGQRTLSRLFPTVPAGLGQFYAALARAYAERGVQLLLVAEDAANADNAAKAAVLGPLLNVAGYFRLPTVLLDLASTGPVPGFDLTLGGGSGATLPLQLLQDAPDVRLAQSWRARGAPLLVTESEVPPSLSAEQLAAWAAALETA